MRERTTWSREKIKQAAVKTADPYLMNQDHVNKQPKPDEYVTGDPSSFGEDITPSKDSWEAEYAGGQVRRDEIGMPEMRKDTFNHPEKTASHEVLLKKGSLAIRVATMMLPKTASEQAIEDQSVALMHMPDAELVNTFNRLADDQEGEGQGQEDQQQKQADQQMQSAYQQAQEQCKAAIQAGDEEGTKQAIEAMIQAQMQQQAQGQQQAPVAQGQQQAPVAQGQQQAPVSQQMVEQMVQAAVKKAQQQQQVAQGQQQVAQGQQQQVAQGQQQQAPVGQGQQQAPVGQGQQQAPVADDAMLDEMLLGPDEGMSEMDIEMDTPAMDTGDMPLGPEDEVLKTLFANEETEQAEQAEQAQQQKQAGMSRTASTRTIGTRPSGGVSRVGGTPAPRGGEDRLSSLWNTAPDVKDAFS